MATIKTKKGGKDFIPVIVQSFNRDLIIIMRQLSKVDRAFLDIIDDGSRLAKSFVLKSF